VPGVLRKVRAFIRLGRPQFLGGGFLLFALGALIAARAGAVIDWGRYATGQLAVTAFQLMTHYANDYFDYEADVANLTPTRWSGGSRVLPGAELPRVVALLAAVALAALGLAVSAHLVLGPGPGLRGVAGPLAVPALLAIFVLAWGYSAPPLRLHSTGFGELDTAVVVTALVPFVGFHLQAPDLVGVRLLVLAVVPLCLLQFAMLLAIEFPDAAGDRQVGKRTLVVRLGGRRAARLYAAVTVGAFALLPVAWLAGLPGAVALAAGALAPVAVWRARRARAGDWRRPRRWEQVTFWAVALLVGTTLAELLAFAVPLALGGGAPRP
jgi:1,4-dihydroxy-2-naphthoate polyprenyltransferase